MNRLMAMKYTVVLLPAFAMGISVAVAEDGKCDCPCDEQASSVSVEQSHARELKENAAIVSSRASDKAEVNAVADAAFAKANCLEEKNAANYFSSNLIGHDVMNRRDNKIVGKVNELLIDENGQIGAVIISTGGVMGLGKKDLAIAWNQVERKVDGDNITLSVDVSDGSLVQAPTFSRK